MKIKITTLPNTRLGSYRHFTVYTLDRVAREWVTRFSRTEYDSQIWYLTFGPLCLTTDPIWP